MSVYISNSLKSLGLASLVVFVGCGDTPTAPFAPFETVPREEAAPPEEAPPPSRAGVARVYVTPRHADFGLGRTAQLKVTAYDADGNTLDVPMVRWSSSDTLVAMVNAVGVVTGAAVGSATITAQHGDMRAEAAIAVWSVSILIDASRDGGVWWFPQYGSFDPAGHHQGKALADYLRSLGFHVRELPRPTEVTASLLDGYHLVIRAVACGSYTGSEIRAYRGFVEEGGSLLLLSDHKRHCAVDEVGRSFGLWFLGITEGRERLVFVPDPVTEGSESGGLYFNAGSGLVQIPPEAKVLAYLDEESFLDLNFNGSREPGEPIAPAVMGRMPFGQGLIVFVGDGNFMNAIPQPFTDNVLRVLLPDVLSASLRGSGVAAFLAQPVCVAGC